MKKSIKAFDNTWNAAVKLGNWRKYYNRERHHSSLEDLTPREVCRAPTGGLNMKLEFRLTSAAKLFK